MGAPGTSEGPWKISHSPSCIAKQFIDVVREEDGAVIARTFAYADSQAAVNAHQLAASGALYDALEVLFRSYKQLADSGDAGNWSLEDLDEGKQALAALSLARGES